MTDAPVSPIATQETVEEIANRIADGIIPNMALASGSFATTETMRLVREQFRLEIRDALSSAERRIEELVRERDGWKAEARTQQTANNLYREALDERDEFKNRMRAAEALVTTLKAEVEELKRERDEARAALEFGSEGSDVMTMNNLRVWRDERDAVLLGGNVDALIAHMAKWGSPVPPNREIAEITLHKARTGCLSLPMAERSLSKGWLFARGMTAMDEGDVPLPQAPTGRETSGEET